MENESGFDKLSCELRDVLEMIHRYNVSHKEGCFLYSFVGWEKDMENKCEECGDYCSKICDDKTM